MSRSHKYNPFHKWAPSNKKDKKRAHRVFRRKEKQNIETAPIKMKEVSDTWSFASDGLAGFLDLALSPDQEDIFKMKQYMRK